MEPRTFRLGLAAFAGVALIAYLLPGRVGMGPSAQGAAEDRSAAPERRSTRDPGEGNYEIEFYVFGGDLDPRTRMRTEKAYLVDGARRELVQVRLFWEATNELREVVFVDERGQRVTVAADALSSVQKSEVEEVGRRAAKTPIGISVEGDLSSLGIPVKGGQGPQEFSRLIQCPGETSGRRCLQGHHPQGQAVTLLAESSTTTCFTETGALATSAERSDAEDATRLESFAACDSRENFRFALLRGTPSGYQPLAWRESPSDNRAATVLRARFPEFRGRSGIAYRIQIQEFDSPGKSFHLVHYRNPGGTEHGPLFLIRGDEIWQVSLDCSGPPRLFRLGNDHYLSVPVGLCSHDGSRLKEQLIRVNSSQPEIVFEDGL